MMILFQLGVIFILSKTITCWLYPPGCNNDCHHGHCQWGGKYWYCACYPGWYGERCDHECNLDCHHGSCQLSGHGHMYCACNQGFYGAHCNLDCRHDCRNGNCQQDKHHLWYCACSNGWTGERCDHADHCASHPCQNGGDCHEDNHRPSGYECRCQQPYRGDNCEVAPATSAHDTIPTTTTTLFTTTSPTTPMTPTKTTTTTTTAQTTTLVPSFTTTCSKFVTVLDMAEKVIETNNLALQCSSGNHSSHEALVINICHPITPSTWKQGYNVMTFCDQIPPYTPIASFENGKYSSADSRSGIFIGCLHGPDGFKAAFQRCDEVAKIENIIVGEAMFSNNPNNFFTLEP